MNNKAQYKKWVKKVGLYYGSRKKLFISNYLTTLPGKKHMVHIRLKNVYNYPKAIVTFRLIFKTSIKLNVVRK